ncbi:MAG: RNase adapter RapZ [Nitrospirae bacterium]|nr:RNase adapter RapZ [Nitrospirota bacterium]
MSFVVVSGLSGSGKSHAIKSLEDLGFFCVDNLPPPLLPKFVELCAQAGMEFSKVALGIDIRERDFIRDVPAFLRSLREAGHRLELVFLEASEEALIRRFRETRRPHPLGGEATVAEGIRREREQLRALRDLADRVIDTTQLSVHQLRETLTGCYGLADRGHALSIVLVSFGYKFGIPYDADLLFDVRFLPNPYFVEGLRPHTGHDAAVREYVFRGSETGEFLKRVQELLHFLIPYYQREGKSYLTIGIGCTGGRHRSIVIAEALKAFWSERGIPSCSGTATSPRGSNSH